jgi:SAM-dependent methyltransferase
MHEPTALSAVYRDRVYENSGFQELVRLVDPAERHVLDVGCGAGDNLRLLAERGHSVTGVTLSEREAAICRARGFRCEIADITQPLPFEEHEFDAAVLSHVVEHVPWPEAMLSNVLRHVRPGGGVYVAVPNALFIAQRLAFIRGRFRYAETGIMDHTHLRFFDFDAVPSVLARAGVAVRAHFGVGFLPQGPLRRIAPRAARALDRLATRVWPSLFAFHVVVAGNVRDSGCAE